MTHPSDDELEAMAALLQNVSNDALYNGLFGISRILAEAAALLRACKGRVRVKALEWRKSERGFRWEETACGSYVIFYKSEGDATLSHGATTVTVAEYDGDNMGVKCKAAAQADYEARILSALEPAPDHEQWNAAIEAAKAVVRLVKEDCFAPMTRTRDEAFAAACGEVERQIDKLKKGPDHD